MGHTADVLVVGAGPTGLMLAGELAAAGVACTVVERRGGESNLTRAFAVHARTLELLDACGVADELVATGEPVPALRVLDRFQVDLSRLPTRFPYVLITPQYHTERILEERAKGLGAEIVRGAELVGLRQDDTGVEAEVRDEQGTMSVRRGAYLVGADGVRSRVREQLGLPFPGRSAVRSVMLADVRLADAPAEVLTVGAVGDDFAFLAPFGDGWYRLIAWNRHTQLPDDVPVDPDELRVITRRVHGTDFGMDEPRWTSRFHSEERQVPRYRVGRVFLAGDAAHVHSPAGGQGMNTGLQDATNLGWKLAAAVYGWAPDGLLDTYHTERHPVGRAVVRGSGRMLRIVFGLSPPARAARALLTRVVGPLGLVPHGLARAVSGLAVAYPAPRRAHRMVGKRAADIPLGSGPGRLYEALRGRRFVLLSRRDQLLPDSAWADRVDTAMTGDALVASALLVRPDGYVAWASDQAAAPALDGAVREALTRWCGPPRVDLAR